MKVVTLLTIMESAFSTCMAEVRQNSRWDDDTTVEVRILGCTEEVHQNLHWFVEDTMFGRWEADDTMVSRVRADDVVEVVAAVTTVDDAT